MEQETVFVYKKGNNSINPKESKISERLNQNNPPPPEFQHERLSRFLESFEILDSVYHQTLTNHNQTLLSSFLMFSQTCKSVSELPLSIVQTGELDLSNSDYQIVKIHKTECPNLKITVKLIVDRFTKSSLDVNTDRRLTYDFDVLVDWYRNEHDVLVVVVDQADAFDREIIKTLISYMASYKDRIPLHLVLQMSTPLMLLESQLTQDQIVCVKPQLLRGQPDAADFVNGCTKLFYERPSLQLHVDNELIERLTKLDIEDAYQQFKYATLAFFAGNPFACTLQYSELPCSTSLSEDRRELFMGGKILDHVFNPNYRPLVELALSDCRHFTGDNDYNRDSVPMCVLYQLYRDSSIYINIFDFYTAFKEMLTPIENCDWGVQSMAFFLETIAAFKSIGILRDCKRKFECVEKVSFKGV